MANDIKLFDKWTFNGVIVSDQGLENYINLIPIVIPRTNAYHHNSAFYKTKVNIVERIINRLSNTGHKGKKHLISSGHNTGKSKAKAKIIYEVFEILEKRTKENPIQVLVTAIENSAPREEVITIERSGARYAQAVDMGPQRRVDIAIRNICQGSSHKAFNSKNSIIETLSNEIYSAYKKDDTSFAFSKRLEVEKMAASAK